MFLNSENERLDYMKTAMITGLTGMDGSNLAAYLLDLGYKVVGMERRISTPNHWRLDELGIADHPNLIIESGDLTDQGSLDRIVANHKPDEVYNLAAQSFVGASWDQPVMTTDITGVGVLRLLEAVRNFHPEAKVYQAGSSEMFGGARRIEQLSEESDFQPRSPYGCAKVFGFNIAVNYRESFGMFVSNGILFNHEGPHRGIEFVTRKVTDAVARIALGQQEKLELYNLDSARDWGDSRDFIRGMHLMLQQDEPGDYVLATGVVKTLTDLVETTFAKVGISNWQDYLVLTNNDRPADVKYLWGDASKAERELGWTCDIDFDQMITEMLDADLERVRAEMMGERSNG
jgi:GDPmannose 4,6-dehydratase